MQKQIHAMTGNEKFLCLLTQVVIFLVFCARYLSSPRCQPDIKHTHMCLCPKEHVLQQQRKKGKKWIKLYKKIVN